MADKMEDTTSTRTIGLHLFILLAGANTSIQYFVYLALVSESKTQSSNASNATGAPTSAYSTTSILTSTPPTTSPSPSNPPSPSLSSASTATSSSPNSSAASPSRSRDVTSPPVSSSSEDDPTRPAAIALGTVLSFLCLIVLLANLLMIWLFVKRRQRRRRRQTSSLDGKRPDSHSTFENRYLEDNDLDSSSRQQASPIEEPTPNKSRGKRLADKLREVTPNETDSTSSDSDASNESTNSIQPGTVRIEWPQLTLVIHNSPTYKTQISTVSSDSQRPKLVRQRPAQIPGQLGYNDCSV